MAEDEGFFRRSATWAAHRRHRMVREGPSLRDSNCLYRALINYRSQSYTFSHAPAPDGARDAAERAAV